MGWCGCSHSSQVFETSGTFCHQLETPRFWKDVDDAERSITTDTAVGLCQNLIKESHYAERNTREHCRHILLIASLTRHGAQQTRWRSARREGRNLCAGTSFTIEHPS